MTTSDWPPGSRSRFVDLGGRVRLTEYGDPTDPRPLLCLHGLGGSALNFGCVAPRLAQGRRVIVPDLLGHGWSWAPPAAEGAVEAQLRMVDRLIEEETDGRVILVGHSMGGILALLHALRAPETTERLVLIDPPVPAATRDSRDLRLAAKLAMLRLPGVGALVTRRIIGMTPEQLVRRQLGDATPHVERIPDVAVRATVRETRESRQVDGGRAGQQTQFQAILDTMAILARPAMWRRRLGDVAAPTLWLHGEDDPLSPVHDARALAATRPDWDFRTRAGVGHLPHLEDPEWTARAISAWVDKAVDGRVASPLEITLSGPLAESVTGLLSERYDDVTTSCPRRAGTVLTFAHLDQAGERAVLNLLWDTGHQLHSVVRPVP